MEEGQRQTKKKRERKKEKAYIDESTYIYIKKEQKQEPTERFLNGQTETI